MKKLVLFTFIVLLLSGCTANYEINLKDDKVEEKLTIIETNKSIFDKELDTGWTIRQSFESMLEGDEFGEENYNVKSLITDDQLGIEYTSKSALSILNSSIVNQCYRNPSVSISNNIISIDTGSNFECYDFYENLESVRVVFKTNHKVISTNSDSKEGNSYIWNITKDGNKTIQITYDDSITKKSIIPYIIIGIVAVVIIISGCFVLKKVKNKNSF